MVRSTSMTGAWDRRSRRITYQVPVGLVELDKGRVFSAASINVSSGGMFVDTSEGLAVGTELMCNVPFRMGREALQLRGKVAWLRDRRRSSGQRPTGMGIEFVDMSDVDSDGIMEIVGDGEEISHPVNLQLPGVGAQVRASAKFTDQGMFIRAELPFLAAGSVVEIAGTKGDTHRGSIAGISIREHPKSLEPQLQVQVELDASSQFRRRLSELETSERELLTQSIGDKSPDAFPLLNDVESHDTEKMTTYLADAVPHAIATAEQPIDAGIHDAAPVMIHTGNSASIGVGHLRETIGAQTDAEEQNTGSAKRLWLLSIATFVLFAGIVAYGMGMKGDEQPPSAEPRVHSERARVRALIEGEDAGTKQEEYVGIAEEIKQVPVESPPLVPTYTSTTKTREIRPPVVTRQKIDKSRDTTSSTSKEKLVPNTDSPTKVHSSTRRKTESRSETQESIHGVSISDTSQGLVLQLPIEGKIDGFKTYALAGSNGLAINLPFAQPRFGFENSFQPATPRVRSVRIRKREEGLHFRVYFQTDVPKCRATIQKQELIVIRCPS